MGTDGNAAPEAADGASAGNDGEGGGRPPPPDSWHGWDPTELSSETRDNPHPMFARLRESVPVHRTPAGVWRLLRHADVVRALRDTKVGMRTTDGVLPDADESLGERRFMLQQDPPNHTRLRRIVSHAFTPPKIAAMVPHVERLVSDILDRVQDRGQLDVIADLARPLPSTVICQMLDVPLSDRGLFTDWTSEVTHLLAPRYLTPQQRERSIHAGAALWEYFTALIDDRRKHLGEDMLSVLIRAEEEGERLSTDELTTQAIGLLVAGFETTIGLIGNGVRQLILHPGELDKLVRRPALIGPVVEECLRYDGPISATIRVLHQDATFGGYDIPRNSQLLLCLASAQRDPRVIPDPDRFDVEREGSSHLAFGGGIHFCLGSHLARMETRVAIGALVERMPRLELMRDDIVWGRSLFRVQGELPVRFGC